MLILQEIYNNISISDTCRDRDIIDLCLDGTPDGQRKLQIYKRNQLSSIGSIVEDINNLDNNIEKFNSLSKPLEIIKGHRMAELEILCQNVGYCNKLITNSDTNKVDFLAIQ